MAFFGDFNYRLFGITYDEARDFISQRSFDWLRERDQLRQEMKAGKVFQGMREALITFPPTYKFERNRPGLGGKTFISLHKNLRQKFRLYVFCTFQDMIQGRKNESLHGVIELYIETLNLVHSHRAVCNVL